MTKRKFLFLLSSALLITWVMLIYSNATSPLYPGNFSWDSALFRFIGSEVLHGKVLYRDVWDHKGPVLFLINALGAVGGTLNRGWNFLFLMQICSLSVSVFFLYKSYKSAVKEMASDMFFLFCLVCSLSVFILTIEGGNLTEEWSMPFICCSLYCFTKYIVQAESKMKHFCRYAFVHGICFSLLAFLRLNNAVTVCVGTAVICVYLAFRKQWKNLLQNGLSFLGGAALSAAPIIVYFQLQGTLRDMIYAVFSFNLKYSSSNAESSFTGQSFLLRYLPLMLSFLPVIFKVVNEKKIHFTDIFTLAVTAGNGVMLWKANTQFHYFTVFVPVFLFVMVLYLKKSDRFLLLLYFCLFVYFGFTAKIYAPINYELMTRKNFPSVERYMHYRERNSAIAINVQPSVYLNTGIKPCSRFIAYQNIHFAINEQFKKEFITTVLEKKPMWIIKTCGECYEEIDDLLEREYTYQFNEPGACFYQRNEH